ncbi:MAG: SDR family oxidoreductase [Georgfuchsia sp.]
MRVFITGASSGIGAALARAYTARGATLALVARREAVLSELAAALSVPSFIYPLDVANAEALQTAANDFISRAGLPDVVIANAGVSAGTLTEETSDLKTFERIFATNVMGMVNTFAPFAAAMRQRGNGRLVGIASVAGVRGLPGAGAYSASKAATFAYLEALRIEMRDCGVKVVTIAPGYIATPMTAVNEYPMPFLLDAEEAAQRMLRAIDRGARRSVVPWQMGVVATLMRLLPDAIYDRLAARAGRKPRGLSV